MSREFVDAAGHSWTVTETWVGVRALAFDEHLRSGDVIPQSTFRSGTKVLTGTSSIPLREMADQSLGDFLERLRADQEGE